MGLSDIFDVIDTVVDIVKDGYDAYKSGEKLEELIEKSIDDYEEELSADEKALYKNYLKAKENYEEKSADDENNTLLEKYESCQVKYLEAIAQNSSLPQDFRDEIKNAVEEFKKDNNKTIEKLGERFAKRAENDEQREFIKKTIDDAKMK